MGNDLIDIKCQCALLIGFIGRKYPQKITCVLPSLAKELEKILKAHAEPPPQKGICPTVRLAINIAQAFGFIAEGDVSALRPYRNVFKIGAEYWEDHIRFSSSGFLEHI